MRSKSFIILVSLGGLTLQVSAQSLPSNALPKTPGVSAIPTTNLSAADEQAVRTEMATIVEDAVIPQRFDQLINQFSRLDREIAERRAVVEKNVSTEKLDAAIADFQKAWKEKYHQDFNLRGNEAKVFNREFARIDIGDFGDTARIASERVPPPTTAPVRTSTGTKGVNTTPPRNPASAPSVAGDSIRANNRAIVTFPEEFGAASFALMFVQEGAVWKLDAPGQADRQLLQDALARHLQGAVHDQSQWPADENAAYRLVAHHVFLAIHEATMMKSGTDTGSRASIR